MSSAASSPRHSTCFVALLLELVFPRATAGAAGMLHQRPTPLWVSGLLGTIAIAPAVLLLIISIAGLSLAGTLLCGVIGIALMSSAFAGCATPAWSDTAKTATPWRP